MKLYKNVDIKDLDSILKNGILPISKTGNDNWGSGNRVNNSKNVVYLFKALNTGESFVNYGLVLIEVDAEAKENKMSKLDINKNSYIEYVVDEVKPEQIKNIYIPSFINVNIQDSRIKKIEYSCKVWIVKNNDFEKVELTGEIKEQFEKTCEIQSTDDNFFRGVNVDRTMIDITGNVKYLF